MTAKMTAKMTDDRRDDRQDLISWQNHDQVMHDRRSLVAVTGYMTGFAVTVTPSAA